MTGVPSLARRLGQTEVLWAVPLVVLMTWLHATRVPYDNELIYLLEPYKAWHPNFLASDWMFEKVSKTHLLFNVLAGLPMRLVGFEVVGWIGRLGAWLAIALAFLTLGRQLRLPAWMSAASVAVWLTSGKSLLGGEWMVGGFESKVVAYPLLLLSLAAFYRRRDRLGGVLLGLCFSFHVLVGFSATFAAFVALMFTERRWRETARIFGWFALCALPGFLTVALSVGDTGPGGRELWRFIVTIVFPSLLDPVTFPRRHLLLIAVLFGFVVLHTIRHWGNPAVRFSGLFLGALGVVAFGGVVVRLAGWYELLQIFPFRLFFLLAPVWFFLHLAHAYRHHRESPLGGIAVVTAIVGLLLYPNPLVSAGDQIRRRDRSWQPDETELAFTWIRLNTEPDATIIADPFRRDGYYAAQRAQTVSIMAPHYERLAEWKARVDLLLGSEPPPVGLPWHEMQARFAALTVAQIDTVASRLGGDYLVTTGAYPYLEVHRVGGVKVYRLGHAEPEAPAIQSDRR